MYYDYTLIAADTNCGDISYYEILWFEGIARLVFGYSGS